jgi:proteasome lid subunit RPN8/RPN11
MRREVLETLIHLARSLHPREMIALLRGRVGDEIVVEEVLLAPLAMTGEDFSEFPMDALPVDPSIIGTAHSHPVPDLRMSDEDLAENFGRLSVVVAYPYRGLQDMAAYSPRGSRMHLRVLEE